MSNVIECLCYACGSEGAVLYANEPDRVFSAAGAWSVFKCSNAACGLLWLYPSPNDEELTAAYANYYTHGNVSQSKIYRTGSVGYRIFVAALLLIIGIPVEQARLRRMYLSHGCGKSLLDVGCGDGDFLYRMRQRGWVPTGIDPDPKAIEIAQGRIGSAAVCGDLSTISKLHKKYDVIAANHVIEHVRDPIQFLQLCSALLRDNGRVVLLTPNALSLGHRLYGRYWRGLEVPRHLFVFSRNALAQCAERAGFGVEAMFTTSANAGGMICVSQVIARYGRYDKAQQARGERLFELLTRPFMALRARFHLMRDRDSGEEIYMVLRPLRRVIGGTPISD